MTEHPFPPPFRCTECHRVLPNRVALWRHLSQHIRGYACSVCHISFPSAETVRSHRLRHHIRPARTAVFRCGTCKAPFRSPESLLVHSKRNAVGPPWKCKACDLTVRHCGKLALHYDECHAKKEGGNVKSNGHIGIGIECHICQKHFSSQASLDRHRMSVHSRKRLKCSLCFGQFKTALALRKHVLSVHAGAEVMSCTVCRMQFTSSDGLRDHVWSHVADKMTDDEGKSANDRTLLDSYRYEPFPIKRVPDESRTYQDDQLFRCPECPRAFLSRKSVSLHHRVHIKSLSLSDPPDTSHSSLEDCPSNTVSKSEMNMLIPLQLYPCCKCSKVYTTRGGLSYHTQVHAKSKFFCVKCKAPFVTEASCRLHSRNCYYSGELESSINESHVSNTVMKSVSKSKMNRPIPFKAYPCRKCPKVCISKHGFKYHTQVHAKSKFFCVRCKAPFMSEVSSRAHSRNCHYPGERKSSINESHVSKPFSFKPPAQVGLDERTYKCNFCTRSFCKRNHLTNHLRAAHAMSAKRELAQVAANKVVSKPHKRFQPFNCEVTEEIIKERPYPCLYCPWRFKNSGHRSEHMAAQHTGEKLFSCLMCRRSFCRRIELKTHQC